ncbi:MAG: sensor hybrid histidine kinase, partial [Armatimonadetes bacterium]|nr:sensor hybrid histidine kinase [Armatimonadota bacterium]
MPDFLRSLFTGDPFMPHIHCFLENRSLTILHVLSDALIGISYVVISTTLAYLVYRGRRHIPFHSMFLAFGAFIVACGMTHFMEIWTLWTPAYWLSGGVKAITAAASVITAIALPPLVPMTIKMIRDANLSEQRRIEVEEANEELSRLNARLQEFDNLKTQFFANVSHELRTPLTLILGPTDRLLAAPELGDAERAVLGSIRENANTLLRHVNDLLDVARMESGEMTVRHANIDLSRLVRVAVANFESLAQERSLRLSVDAPQHLIARVDEEKLRRVLVNLVSNALKFTPDRGLVRVRVTESTGESAGALIQVADSGPGVPEELREAVFERFRQVDGGATRRHEGTGLGLSIVRDFVGLHGGTVSLDAAPEGGARFTVWLPLG